MTVTGENGKKKKVVDETAFHPDLQKAITEMKGLIANGMLSRCKIHERKLMALRNRVLGTEREIPSGTQTSFRPIGFACHSTGRIRR